MKINRLFNLNKIEITQMKGIINLTIIKGNIIKEMNKNRNKGDMHIKSHQKDWIQPMNKGTLHLKGKLCLLTTSINLITIKTSTIKVLVIIKKSIINMKIHLIKIQENLIIENIINIIRITTDCFFIT